MIYLIIYNNTVICDNKRFYFVCRLPDNTKVFVKIRKINKCHILLSTETSYTEVLFKVSSQLFYSICACQLDLGLI